MNFVDPLKKQCVYFITILFELVNLKDVSIKMPLFSRCDVYYNGELL